MTNVLLKINIILFDGIDEKYDTQIAKSSILTKAKGQSNIILSAFEPRINNIKLKQDAMEV